MVTHGHGEDVLLHGREPRAFAHALELERRIEEGNVVGDGTGEQVILLHDGADQRPIGFDAELRDVGSAHPYLAAAHRQQAQHDFEQRGLSATGRTDDGHRFAFRASQIGGGGGARRGGGGAGGGGGGRGGGAAGRRRRGAG